MLLVKSMMTPFEKEMHAPMKDQSNQMPSEHNLASHH
jgi:hypothetical protein